MVRIGDGKGSTERSECLIRSSRERWREEKKLGTLEGPRAMAEGFGHKNGRRAMRNGRDGSNCCGNWARTFGSYGGAAVMTERGDSGRYGRWRKVRAAAKEGVIKRKGRCSGWWTGKELG
ncbi:unnamed protein product [Calypogeia fissa]